AREDSSTAVDRTSPADPTDRRIAVIGMSVRFPGADSPAQFWQNLRDGVESIRRLSTVELRAAGLPDEQIDDPHFVPAVPWIDGIDRFDADLFGYGEAEAA